MKPDFSSEQPIFIQTARWLEENILSGSFPEGSRIPSTTEISSMYKINPATALKGINLLVDKDIIYKKRGLGMYVAEGARQKIQEDRKKAFFKDYVITLLNEAKKLDIPSEEIINMIRKGSDEI